MSKERKVKRMGEEEIKKDKGIKQKRKEIKV